MSVRELLPGLKRPCLRLSFRKLAEKFPFVEMNEKVAGVAQHLYFVGVLHDIFYLSLSTYYVLEADG